MLSKDDLEPVFEAWYDHKMEPAEADLLRRHLETLGELQTKLADIDPVFKNQRKTDLRKVLGGRFSSWMKEHNLPEPKKEA